MRFRCGTHRDAGDPHGLRQLERIENQPSGYCRDAVLGVEDNIDSGKYRDDDAAADEHGRAGS